MGLTKSFFEEKLNVSVQGFTNLKGGAKAKFEQYSEGSGFTTEGYFAVPIRRIGIELTYSFGKNNFQVKKAQRTITNDDVVNAQNAVQQQSSQTNMQ